MKPKALAGCLGLILSLLSCASHPRVLFDFDQKEDFSRFSTFAFTAIPEELATEVSPSHVDVLKSAVIRELQARGLAYLQDDAETADLLIAVHTEPRQRFNITLWGYHYARYDDYWRSDEYWQGGGIDEHAYPQGTVILDFVRADEEDLIWRGVCPEAIPPGDTGKDLKTILDRAVSEILKTFPSTKRSHQS